LDGCEGVDQYLISAVSYIGVNQVQINVAHPKEEIRWTNERYTSILHRKKREARKRRGWILKIQRGRINERWQCWPLRCMSNEGERMATIWMIGWKRNRGLRVVEKAEDFEGQRSPDDAHVRAMRSLRSWRNPSGLGSERDRAFI
jgi:hypothetical protein